MDLRSDSWEVYLSIIEILSCPVPLSHLDLSTAFPWPGSSSHSSPGGHAGLPKLFVLQHLP